MGSSPNWVPFWVPTIVRHPYNKDPKKGPYFREPPIYYLQMDLRARPKFKPRSLEYELVGGLTCVHAPLA